ncbi:hypothetical protein Tco_0874933 [Tanacetum coccineum]|uniref:Reverse transcriptase domain-containing protein n=1 Tax=Tanacetum coccineum TaxID=301880 RepID=A0ABQ5BR15_9ASTR
MAPGRRLNVNRNPPVNHSTNRNNVDINSGIDTQMLNQLISTRVAEALAAAAVTHAASTQEETNLGSNSSQNKTCNYKEFYADMHENFHGTEGAVGLTRWFEKLESQFGISNVAKELILLCPEMVPQRRSVVERYIEVVQEFKDQTRVTSGNEPKLYTTTPTTPNNTSNPQRPETARLVTTVGKAGHKPIHRLKVKGINSTAYNQRFQELILLCPEMVPNANRLLECYIEGLPLSIKGNVTSSKPATNRNGMETTTTITPTTPTTLATSTRTNAERQQGCLQPDKVLMLASYLTAKNVDDTTLMHAFLLVTTVERQDIRPKTAKLHLALQTKEDLEANEDRAVMLLVLDVVRKDITRKSVQAMGNKAVGIKFEATSKTIRTIKGRIRGTLREVTKHQPVLKEDVGHLAEYTAYVLKQL